MIRLLHGGGDAAAFRLIFALAELDLPYVSEQIDLMALEQWEEPYLTLSGTGAVPLLIDGALVMDDAPIALHYLAEIRPEASLWPSDPVGRYDAHALQDRLDALTLDSINALGWNETTSAEEREDYLVRLERVPGRPRPAGWSAVWRDAIGREDRLTYARGKLGRGIACIEQTLGEREWLVHDCFSVADIAAFALVRPLPELMPEAASWETAPRFMAWLERVASRPGCRRALASVSVLDRPSFFAPPRWANSD